MTTQLISQIPFKARIELAQKRQIPLIGSWLMTANPIISELMATAGFEFLVVDMEHSPMDVPDMVGMLHALSGTQGSPVVRLPWSEMVLVKRVLDAGAQTVMFPFIQNKEEAEAAVSYTRYPPNGVRGVAAMHRGSRFGTFPNFLKDAHKPLTIILQIETPEALAQLEDIASVDGVDAIFVGPGDLSTTMGYPGQIGAQPVQDALKEAAARCKKMNIPCGIVGADSEMIKTYQSYGYDFVAIASDLALLMNSAKQAAQTFGTSTLQVTQSQEKSAY
ncbi:HpcH/HpaI aldolase family protein [Thorsellia kenyensis]|uniref:HpcH/HpaI aldolase/citrate lyase family protein n=1 Tax=Thorsellia kenyensis TaxID=1549888 RepID=A0ABV6CD20_9GAMM